MFKTLFRRKASRFTVPALAAMVLAGGIAAAPAEAGPPQPLRIQSYSADLLVLAQSHREYRRDGDRHSRSDRWQKRRSHERAKRPHHRRHIVKRDWRRDYRGHRAKRHNWRRHYNRSRSDWGHQARRNYLR